MEGLHGTVHTHTCTILSRLVSFSFCMAWCREKQQKMLELWIYFIEGIKISTECVCVLTQGLDFVPSRENHIWFSPDSFARINWFSFYDKIYNTTESNCYAN